MTIFPKILRSCVRFVAGESGVTAVEWGLMVALVAVGMLVGATLLGTSIFLSFDNTRQQVETSFFGGGP